MAKYNAEGIVIGARNFGETDKMLTIFTRERGVVKATAFGCRRPKSPLAASCQMFNQLEMELSEGAKLDTLRQTNLLHHPKKLSENLECMAYGSFVAELLREFLPEKQADKGAYERTILIMAAFQKRNPRITALTAGFQLMEFTGLQLHYENCVHCGKPIKDNAFFDINDGGVLCPDCRYEHSEPFSNELREFIVSLLDFDWQEKSKLMVSRRELLQAENLMLRYLQNLLGHPLKSLAFISQLA